MIRSSRALSWLLVALVAGLGCWVSKRPVAADRDVKEAAPRGAERPGWTGLEAPYQAERAQRDESKKATLLDAGPELAPTR